MSEIIVAAAAGVGGIIKERALLQLYGFHTFRCFICPIEIMIPKVRIT